VPAFLLLAALTAKGSEPERGVIIPAAFLARIESPQEASAPSPECLKGYLVNEQEKTSITKDGDEKVAGRGLAGLLDAHALSFGFGCALGTLGLGLLIRGKASSQVINVSMPPTAALPASEEDIPVPTRFRPSGSKRKKSKKTVSYLPAANFELGPSFEEEKAGRDAAEGRKAEAVLAGLVDANLALREAIGEHGQETLSAKA
jgi:hypothetical protein